MERKLSEQVRGFRTKDGAGVSLVRVLGNQTVQEYDPILLLDSFDSTIGGLHGGFRCIRTEALRQSVMCIADI